MAFNPFVTRAARVTVTVTRADSSSGSGTTTSSYVFLQHRMVIRVSIGGGRFGNAKVQIHGVPLAAMNNIARLWPLPMEIQAADTLSIDVWDGSNYAPFFTGTITWSGVNGGALPDVTLDIEANSSASLAQTTPAPYTVSGPQTLQNVLTGILQGSEFALDYAPSIPEIIVPNPRYSGSTLDQIVACMRSYPQLTWNPVLSRLRVYPADQPLGADPILISPATGMRNAPVYSSSAVTLDTVFDPRLVPGQAITIDSEFVLAGGAQWIAMVLNHTLEPNKPKGAWTTSIAAKGIPNTNGSGTAAATS